MAKKRGKVMGQAVKIRRAPAAPTPLLEVTPERLFHAANDTAVVDATIEKFGERGHKTRRFRDTPIERMFLRKLITEAQFNAAEWYLERYAEAGRSQRVVANYGEGLGGSGASIGDRLLGSERQYQALKRWREARKSLPEQMIRLVDLVVIERKIPPFTSGRARDQFATRIGKALQPMAEWLGY